MVQVRSLHAPGADPDCYMSDRAADCPAITACCMLHTNQLVAWQNLLDLWLQAYPLAWWSMLYTGPSASLACREMLQQQDSSTCWDKQSRLPR